MTSRNLNNQNAGGRVVLEAFSKWSSARIVEACCSMSFRICTLQDSSVQLVPM